MEKEGEVQNDQSHVKGDASRCPHLTPTPRSLSTLKQPKYATGPQSLGKFIFYLGVKSSVVNPNSFFFWILIHNFFWIRIQILILIF
jgi:hypothetical protein